MNEASRTPALERACFDLADGELALECVDFAAHPVHCVPTYFFRMVHVASREPLGNISLRTVTTDHIRLYAGHIGYAVHEEHRGHQYASRAVRLLMPVARSLGFASLWITCDPENIASRRSCETAGAHLIETIDVPESCIIHRNGHPRKCRYLLSL